jgi:hypothetical protein
MKTKHSASDAASAATPATDAERPFKLTKAQFRLMQRLARQNSAEAQEVAASIGAFFVAQAAARKAAEKLSEMLHSEAHGLGSIQEHLDAYPVGALALIRLIGLERQREAGHLEVQAHRAWSSKGGKATDLNSGAAGKREEIRRLWATGKFKSRDECAEAVSETLGMSFSTARKALRNTPDPDGS